MAFFCRKQVLPDDAAEGVFHSRNIIIFTVVVTDVVRAYSA